MTMRSSIALRAIAGYGMATFVQGAVAFLSVPMLIRVLGQDWFAIWAIFEPFVLLCGQFALLGAPHGYLRLLATDRAVSHDIYTLHHGNSGYAGWVIALGGAAVGILYLGVERASVLIVLSALLIVFESKILLAQMIARGESDSGTYLSIVSAKYGLIASALAVMSWREVRMPLEGYVAVLVFIDLSVLAGAHVRFRHKRRSRPPSEYRISEPHSEYWNAVRYGMPIVVAGALALLAANGDRYVVHALMHPDDLASYVVTAKLAGALSFAAAPINLWWPAARFKHASDPDRGAAFYSSAVSVLLLYYCAAAVAGWLLSREIIGVYSQGATTFDGGTLALLLIAGVSAAMATPMNIGTLNEGKTHWSIWTVGTAAVVAVVASTLLIPAYGLTGASCGALAGQVCGLLLAHLVSQRIHHVTIGYGKPLVLVLVFGSGLALLVTSNPTVAFGVTEFVAMCVVGAILCAKDIRRLGGG